MVKRKPIVAVVINTPTASGSPADAQPQGHRHTDSPHSPSEVCPFHAQPAAFPAWQIQWLWTTSLHSSPTFVGAEWNPWAQRRGRPQRMRSQERTRASHSEFNLVATFWHLKSILLVVFFCERKDTLRPSNTASEHISRSLPRLEAGLSKVLTVFEILLGTSHAAWCLHSQAYWRFQRS